MAYFSYALQSGDLSVKIPNHVYLPDYRAHTALSNELSAEENDKLLTLKQYPQLQSYRLCFIPPTCLEVQQTLMRVCVCVCVCPRLNGYISATTGPISIRFCTVARSQVPLIVLNFQHFLTVKNRYFLFLKQFGPNLVGRCSLTC